MRLVAIAVAVFLFAVSAFSQTKSAKTDDGEIVFVNGDVYTGSTGQRVQAFRVRDGRIVDVGSGDGIPKAAGSKAQVVDLQGKFVMPGFNDAHLHLTNGGFEKLNVNLIGVKSLAEMQVRIAERAKSTPKGEWITGRGWDHTLWGIKDAPLPTREDIDQVAGDHPAVFGRVDGHI